MVEIRLKMVTYKKLYFFKKRPNAHILSQKKKQKRLYRICRSSGAPKQPYQKVKIICGKNGQKTA
jgi:hypothetical protein